MLYLTTLILISCSTVRVSNKPDLKILSSVPKAPVLDLSTNKENIIKSLIEFSISLRIHINALHEYLRFLARD